jgi:tetratricopeptide (TPR) repeat protein
MLAAAAAVGAAGAFAAVAAFHHSPAPRVQTVVVRQASASQQVSLDNLMLQSTDGRTLNNAAYYLLLAGEWERAIPFAYRAVQFLPHSSLAYTYATFNLGYGLYEAGRCRDALPYLERAVRLEPTGKNRETAHRFLTKARACLRGGASGPAPSQSSVASAGPSAAR